MITSNTKSVMNIEHKAGHKFKQIRSKSVTMVLAILILLTAVLFAKDINAATTYYARQTGNWNSNTTWSLTSGGGAVGSGVFPVAGDIVYIESSFTVTVTANAACASIIFSSKTSNSGTLSINTGITVNVSGSVSLQGSGSRNTAAAISGSGTLNCASMQIGTDGTPPSSTTRTTTLTSTISAISITNNLTISSFIGTDNTRKINSTFNHQSGTITANAISTTNENSANATTYTLASGAQTGTLRLTAASPFTTTGTGTHTVTLNGTSATVNYYATGGGQTVKAATYTTLTFNNNSGTNTAAGAITATTLNTTAGGTLNMLTYAITAVTTVNNSGTIRTQKTATPFPSGKTWGGTVIYDATAGGQTVMSGTYNNLTLSNTSGTQTASGALTVNGALTLASGGTLNMVTYQMLGTLSSVSNSGTIRTQNTSNPPLPNGKTWGSSVKFDGAGQTISSGTYNDLTLEASGTKTMSSGTTVNGNFSISGTSAISATPSSTFTISGSNTIGANATFTLGASNILNDAGALIFNGGTFSSNTSCYSETMGTLALTLNTTLTLGTSTSHTLNFAASNGVSWTPAKILTINGWQGSYNGTAGTRGRIYFGSNASALTSDQLEQIRFYNGTNYYTATLLSSGELVPTSSIYAKQYYSKSSGNLNTLSNWGTNIDGTGDAPANFTSNNQKFNIINNPTPTIGANWTVSGTNSKIVIGNDVDPVNFSVGSNYVLSARVDISASGTLTLTTSGSLGSITIGTLDLGSTVNYARSGDQTLRSGTYSNLTISGSGTKTISGVTVNGVFSREGSATASAAPTYGTNSSLRYGGSSSITTGVEFPSTFNGTGGVIIDNTAGVVLAADRTSTYGLTFNNGRLTTNSNTFILGVNASVTGAGAGKYVNGNLRWNIPNTGSPVRMFDIGDATNYTPVEISFENMSGSAGTLTAKTTLINHPQILSSSINPDYTVNRYWTLTPSGLTFTDYDATFYFVSGDVDAGANTSDFIIQKYASSVWDNPSSMGAQNSLSTEAIGFTSFGDFQIGQLKPVNNYLDPCQDAILTHTYYLPFPENTTQLRQNLINSSSITDHSNIVRTVITLTTQYPKTVLIYDHWEDGYETDINQPKQSTTEIWGDGNLENGIAPGYSNDRISNGGSIILDNSFVYNTRNSSNIYFDGKDKIHANADVAVSKISGDSKYFEVQAVKTDVYDMELFGKSFIIGFGENINARVFRYTSLYIRAATNNTTVNLDYNGDGVNDVSQVLNEGQVWFYEGTPGTNNASNDVKVGTIITATEPVGVDVVMGDRDNFGTRNFNVFPAEMYGSIYYTPVPTTDADHPAKVYFYNFNQSSITINYTTGSGSSGSKVVGGKSVDSLRLTVNSGYRFESVGGKSYTAIQTIDDSDPAKDYDWAFPLIASNRLTDFASVAWAPGSLTNSPSSNYNPIWVVPSANTTIYVKYNGDLVTPSVTNSPCGVPYDIAISLNALNYYRILNPSGDQSGMKLYTCDGTTFAAVYGEDPSTAVVAAPAIDVGTIIAPRCGSPLIQAVDDYVVTQPDVPIAIPVYSNDPTSYNDIGFLCTINPSSVSVTGLLPPSNGSVQVNPDGSITYTPNPGFAGLDTFEYRVCSNEFPSLCDIANVYVNISNCVATVDEIRITGRVFVEQMPDDSTYNGEPTVAGIGVDLYGDINCNGVIDAGDALQQSTVTDLSGNYSFTAILGYDAKDNFDPTAALTGNDGSVNWSTNWTENGESDGISAGFVRILGDDAPGGIGNAIRIGGSSSKGLSRSLTFSNAASATLKFKYRRQGLDNDGEQLLVKLNGTTIFTIDAGSGVGTDNYYQRVVLTLTGYNANGSNTIQFISGTSGFADGDFYFIDDVALTYTKSSNVCFIAKVNPSNTNGNYSAAKLNQQSASFSTIGTCDINNYLGVTVNIIASDDAASTAIDVPVTISVLTNDVVGSPDPATVTTTGMSNQPANGTVQVNPNGTITYTPNPGFTGTDDFEYQVCSSQDPGVCDIALVTVTVSCALVLNQNTITGMVYNDVNSNGALNSGETGRSGVTVKLFHDINGNGVLDSSPTDTLEATQTTNSQGAYQFNVVPPGTTYTRLDRFDADYTANQSHGTASWTSHGRR